MDFSWIDRCSPFTARTGDCLQFFSSSTPSFPFTSSFHTPLAVGMFSQETTTTGKSWAGKESEIEQTGHEWNSYPMWTLEGVSIAQPPCRGGASGDFKWPPTLGSRRFIVLSLTSCSLRRRTSHISESPRAFHKLSASPWLMLPACSNCSRSRELTRPRATHLGKNKKRKVVRDSAEIISFCRTEHHPVIC